MKKVVAHVLLAMFLVAIVVSFTACRNTGYGDFDYVYPSELGSGVIRGTVTRTPGLSIRAVGGAPVPVEGAEVWLEEYPSLRCLTDAQGNYRIIGVPAGTFRVVAKFNDNVTIYKMRSNSNTVVEKDDKVVDLGLLTATNIVRGIMADENGAVLPQGTPVYLWGEVFYIGQNGSFVTPPLPTFEGLNSIFDLVVNPNQPNQFNIPVSFVSADRPLEVVISVPTGGTSASTMPTVLLVAMKDGAIKTTASRNEQLTVTGMITPTDTTNDNLVWSATRGAFANDVQTDGGKRTCTWTAPDSEGIATLSLRITAANGKIATASLPILVGANVTYSVTYNGNGNTGGSVPVDATGYANGANVTVLGNTGNLVKTGSTFAGWNTSADGTGTDRAAASTFAMGNNNVTLYAKWTDNPTYTITYNGNGNTGGSVPVDGSTYANGANVTVLGNTGNLVKTGSTFAGWNTSADGTGTDRAAASTFAMGNANVTLYAKWTDNPTYTITYNGNGNTGGSVPVDGSTYANGANVTVLGNTGNLVKTGSTFAGWNTSADGTGTDRAAASTFAMGNANVTLYAKWTANPTFTVTYNGNGNTGGSVPVDGSTYANGANVTVLANTGTLVKNDASPLGWNTQADGEGTFYPFGGSFNVAAANITLYAVWPTVSADVLPFSLTLSWTNPESANYQFKVVKSNTTVAIDTFAEVNAIAGADVVMDWTADATQTQALNLRSNTTYYLAIAAKKGAFEYLYPIVSPKTSNIAFPNVLSLSNGDLMFAYKDLATNRGKTIVYGTNGLPKTQPKDFYVNNYTVADTWNTKYDMKLSAANIVYIGFASSDSTKGCFYSRLNTDGSWVGTKIISKNYTLSFYGPELAINGDRLFYYTSGQWSGTNQGSQCAMSKVSDNSTLKFPMEVEFGNPKEIKGIAACGVGTDEKFIAFDAAEESNLDLYYSVYNNAGAVSEARAVIANTKSGLMAALKMSNNNAMVAYQDHNDSDQGKIRIYDDAGTLQAGPVIFGTTQNSWQLPMVNTDAGKVLIAYGDGADGDKAKFVVLDTDGTVSVAATALAAGAAYPIGATNVATENKIAIVYKDAASAVYWYDFLNGF